MQLGIKKKETCKFNTLQIHSLIVLMPFFLIRNTSQYPGSSLGRLFSFEKDMFYRFMNNRNVRWCKLLYAMNLQLLRKINKETKTYDDKSVCLVIDDTDASKTDRKSEFLSRIFSHGQHRSILEYKCLTMLLTDRCSQIESDFSLHGEGGKNFDRRAGPYKGGV